MNIEKAIRRLLQSQILHNEMITDLAKNQNNIVELCKKLADAQAIILIALGEISGIDINEEIEIKPKFKIVTSLDSKKLV